MAETNNYYINKLNLDPVRENAVRKLLKGVGGVNDSTPLVEQLNGDELIPVKQGEDNKAVSIEQIKNNVLALPSKYEFVDLGLPSGLKWATCNVGASAPEDFGLYFAWGETEGYEGITDEKQFSWADYKLCGGSSNTLTKYNNDSSHGVVDNLTTLEQVDDAAYTSDNTCRMPTRAELEELTANTTSTWETLNGVNGIRFTSKTNGNSIFIPAAGACGNGSVFGVGSSGTLWSSSLSESHSWNAWGLECYLDNVSVYYGNRCIGSSVRAVQSPNTPPTTINLKELQDKVDNIETDGDGTKFLSNDGQYKEIGPYIWDGNTSETIFNELLECYYSQRLIQNGGLLFEPIYGSNNKIVIVSKYYHARPYIITKMALEITKTTVTDYSAGNFISYLNKENRATVILENGTYVNLGTLTINTTYNEQAGVDLLLNEYQGEFSFGDTLYTVTFPSTIKWSTDSVLEYKANHTYQFKIVNGFGVMKEFANS